MDMGDRDAQSSDSDGPPNMENMKDRVSALDVPLLMERLGEEHTQRLQEQFDAINCEEDLQFDTFTQAALNICKQAILFQLRQNDDY